ncbi:hypothetical protein [uncultured Fusobacterium sp.]|uniref:hypothetical protein n=1 Tax=uncultured Fusobacterium sp. TaxID=159267 RepID=UPI0025D65C20|nr:hypothetical protein [uncultured Fusobacterium sp.]
MIRKTKIIFESGRILNSKMLNELQNFSLRNIEIKYYDYSNGIIEGLNFESDNQYLYLTPGFLKYNNEYYFLNEKMIVMSFDEKGGQKYIYLSLKEPEERENIYIKELELVISNEELDESVIYLGKFQHYQNSSIKTDYKTLEDIGQAGNYINIVNRKYAGKIAATLSPEILYFYAKRVMNEVFSSNLDNYIFNKGLNREIVEMDILKEYLKNTDDFKELYLEFLNKKFLKQEKNKEEKKNKQEKTFMFESC